MRKEFRNEGWLSEGLVTRTSDQTLDTMEAVASQLPKSRDMFYSNGFTALLLRHTGVLPRWLHSVLPNTLAPESAPATLTLLMNVDSIGNEGRRVGRMEIRVDLEPASENVSGMADRLFILVYPDGAEVENRQGFLKARKGKLVPGGMDMRLADRVATTRLVESMAEDIIKKKPLLLNSPA